MTNDDEPCPRTEALSALADDALAPPQRLALEAHVGGCAVCAPMLAELRQLRSRMAALPRDVPAFDVAAAVDRRIGALTAPPPAARAPRLARRPWWQLALLAPGGAAAVALGLWLGAAPLPATIASSASISAGAAQMAAFSALPPGSLCPAGRACAGGAVR